MRKGLFVFAIIVFFTSCSGVTLREETFNKVKLGMTIQEVKEIIGGPYLIKKFDDHDVHYFYTRNDMLAKKYAQVWFDKEGRVSFTLYKNPS
jgi:outer membrane protein assembly factor BamE (lipoprotein component of BamABCDE complex)